MKGFALIKAGKTLEIARHEKTLWRMADQIEFPRTFGSYSSKTLKERGYNVLPIEFAKPKLEAA